MKRVIKASYDAKTQESIFNSFVDDVYDDIVHDGDELLQEFMEDMLEEAGEEDTDIDLYNPKELFEGASPELKEAIVYKIDDRADYKVGSIQLVQKMYRDAVKGNGPKEYNIGVIDTIEALVAAGLLTKSLIDK